MAAVEDACRPCTARRSAPRQSHFAGARLRGRGPLPTPSSVTAHATPYPKEMADVIRP